MEKTPDQVDFLAIARTLLVAGRIQEACLACEKAVEAGQDLQEAYFCWGVSLAQMECYEDAFEKFEKATQIQEDHAKAYYFWGLTLASINRYGESIEKFEKATQIKEDYAEAYLAWGKSLGDLKRYDQAIEKFEKATQINEYCAEAHLRWGQSLGNLRRYDQAIEKFEKAIQIDKNYAEAYFIWGLALVDLKRYESAIEKYQKAIHIKKDYAAAAYSCGYALSRLKRYGEAVELYEKVIQIDPDHPYARQNIASLYTSRGMYKEAWEQWEATLLAYRRAHRKQRALSFKADFYQYYGWVVLLLSEDVEEAEKIYKHGLSLDPAHAGILMGLVTLNGVKARKDPENTSMYRWNASEACRKAEEELTRLSVAGDPDALLRLGQLFLSFGRYDEAENYLLKALDGDNERLEIYNGLGVVYAHKERFGKAARYFKEARQLEPDQLSAWSNLAEVYAKLNELDKAEIEYRAILRIAPGHVESHIGLGEVYLLMNSDDENMYEQAIGCFSKALQIADSARGSKKLKGKDRAAVLYSRACARVMSFEKTSITGKNEKPLHEALKDFKESFDLDADNHKAEHAKKRLDRRLKSFSMGWLADKVAPWVISVFSAVVFIFSQANFYFHANLHMERLITNAGYYALLTFGSLVFMVAGLYLPQVLKLKVGGIELEKKPLEQITTSLSLGITKEIKQDFDYSRGLAQ